MMERYCVDGSKAPQVRNPTDLGKLRVVIKIIPTQTSFTVAYYLFSPG